jgi:uncharacterized membrane protein YgcG
MYAGGGVRTLLVLAVSFAWAARLPDWRCVFGRSSARLRFAGWAAPYWQPVAATQALLLLLRRLPAAAPAWLVPAPPLPLWFEAALLLTLALLLGCRLDWEANEAAADARERGPYRHQASSSSSGGSSSNGSASAGGGGASGASGRPPPDGGSKRSLQDFPMGYGPVTVPHGCDVPEVVAVLKAKDYYEV